MSHLSDDGSSKLHSDIREHLACYVVKHSRRQPSYVNCIWHVFNKIYNE
jgi:hypothetical protein